MTYNWAGWIVSKLKRLYFASLLGFCFRKTSDIEINIGIQEVEGWLDYPGAKDKKSGSDHMPVAAARM